MSNYRNFKTINADSFANKEITEFPLLAEANTFTKAQRTSIEALADDTVAIDFRPQNSFAMTMTADADITLATDGTVGTVGQSGVLIVTTAEHITGWGTEFKFKNVPDDLADTELFGYFVEAEDTIRIGRMK